MASGTELKILRKNLIRYEGNINHLYLDTQNNVTIGVGHLVKNLSAAQTLPLYTATGKRATPAEIKLDFDSVKKHPNNLLMSLPASYYQQFTQLKMKPADIQAQLNAHIGRFEKELKRLYFGFTNFPKEARLALFDMIFNLGYPKLKRYTKMNAAIATKDWLTAAKESKRHESLKRDKETYDLFMKANTYSLIKRR